MTLKQFFWLMGINWLELVDFTNINLTNQRVELDLALQILNIS